MPLVTCRECSRQVSADAPSCPGCGTPWPARPNWKGWGVDWRTETEVFGVPLVHVAFGRDAKGRWRVAKGIVAIGQFAVGAITIAQFGLSFLFGFGQLIVGTTAIAQAAFTPLFGIGQIATGYVAVGQIVFGYYGLAQAGWAAHLWTPEGADAQAVDFFRDLARKAGWQ